MSVEHFAVGGSPFAVPVDMGQDYPAPARRREVDHHAVREMRVERRTVYGRDPAPGAAVEVATPAEQRAEAEHAEAVRSRVISAEARILSDLMRRPR